jgi:hypothetical protein
MTLLCHAAKSQQFMCRIHTNSNQKLPFSSSGPIFKDHYITKSTVPMWNSEYIKRRHHDMPMTCVHVYHTEFHALDGDGPYSLELSQLWFRVGQASMLQQCSSPWNSGRCLNGMSAAMPMGTVLNGPEQSPNSLHFKQA